MLKRSLFFSCLFLVVLLTSHKSCALNTQGQREQTQRLSRSPQKKQEQQEDYSLITAKLKKDIEEIEEALNDESVKSEKLNLLDLYIRAHNSLNDKANELISLQKRIDKIENSVKTNEKAITYHITIFTCLITLVLCISALLLASKFVFDWKVTNKYIDETKQKLSMCNDVLSSANDSLIESKILHENLKNDYDRWCRETEKSFKSDLQKIHDEYFESMDHMQKFLQLRNIIEQKDHPVDEVYALLSPLANKPLKLYIPLFMKIIELDIDEQINKKAQEGLDNI